LAGATGFAAGAAGAVAGAGVADAVLPVTLSISSLIISSYVLPFWLTESRRFFVWSCTVMVVLLIKTLRIYHYFHIYNYGYTKTSHFRAIILIKSHEFQGFNYFNKDFLA
jgi:hypothetical protein